MEYLVQQRPRRIYALDFWGFGESDKRQDTYQIADYVSMVIQFMDTMGILKAPVFGHSMGGTVAMSLTLDHPDRVNKVAVTGSPMNGDSLSLLLKFAGKEWVGRLLWRYPPLMNLVMWGYAPWVATGQANIHERMMEHISKSTWMSFSRSIASLRETDLRSRLPEVQIPVLAIYGTSDGVVNPNQAEVIRSQIPQARVEVFEGSKHFPMLSEPDRFHRLLADFTALPQAEQA
jgi:pimeloyl-ACP methyl ester carboxylesterase